MSPGCVLGNDGEQDRVHLEHLNEGSLLHNYLRQGFKNKHIYTCTGSILLSVNPYRLLPIYTCCGCKVSSNIVRCDRVYNYIID